MQVQSADGVMHEFPDEIDPSVVDRVMKNYATQGRTQSPNQPMPIARPTSDPAAASPEAPLHGYKGLPPAPSRKQAGWDADQTTLPSQYDKLPPETQAALHGEAALTTPSATPETEMPLWQRGAIDTFGPIAREARRGWTETPRFLTSGGEQWLRDRLGAIAGDAAAGVINSPANALALGTAALRGGQQAVMTALTPIIGQQAARDLAAIPEAFPFGHRTGIPGDARLTAPEAAAMREAKGWSEAPVTFSPDIALTPSEVAGRAERTARDAQNADMDRRFGTQTPLLEGPEATQRRPVTPEQAAMDEAAPHEVAVAPEPPVAAPPAFDPATARPADPSTAVKPPQVPSSEAPEAAAKSAPSGAYVMVHPEQLTIDPERFQYKAAGDGGVTGALHGISRWEPALANPITAWEGEDGKLYVVNGHQRTDLAMRAKAAGQPDVQMPARVFREADGYTPEYMRALGAYQNMAEGSGSATDAAKVLRSANIIPTDRRLPDLPPKGQVVAQAQALAKLSPEAFGVIENGIVVPGYAAHVGSLIADPTEQMAALDMLARAQPANSEQARLMVLDIRDSGYLRGSQTTLFGDEDFARSLVLERARVLENALRNLRRVKGVFKAAVEGEESLTAAGNKLDREGNIQGRTENEHLLDRLQRNATTRGPISDALTAAAAELAGGKLPAGVVSRFLVEARRLVRTGQDEGVRSGVVADGNEPSGEGNLETKALFSRSGPIPSRIGPDLFGDEQPPAPRRTPEPTIRNDPNQIVMPGMEPSAIQAQASRDAQGPRSNQQPADQGFFAPKEGEQRGLPDLSRTGVGGNAPLRVAAIRANAGVIRRGAQAMVNRLRMQSNLDAAANRHDRRSARSIVYPEDIREIDDFINFIGHEMFSDVGLRIMQDGGGANGAFESGRRIVYLFRKAIDDGNVPHTMVHELWHSLERTLPREDRIALTEEFNRQRGAWLAKNPWAKTFLDNGELRDQLTGREAKAWVDQHTEERGGQRWIADQKVSDAVRVEGIQSPSPIVRMVWTHDNYRFKNRSEYFAETMTDRRFDDQDIHDAKARSVFAHIRDIWRRFVTGIQRLFGRDATGRIYEGFRNREYQQGVEDGLLSGADYAEARAPGRQLPMGGGHLNADILTNKKDLRNLLNHVKAGFSPTALKGAQPMELSIRKHAAEAALSFQRAVHTLQSVREAVDRLSKADQIDFTDRMETGQKQKTHVLQQVADTLRGIIDDWTKTIQGMGRGYLQNAIDDYMGHVWGNHREWSAGQAAPHQSQMANAAQAAAQGKRPLKGSGAFLKRRSFPTQLDGINAGLIPVTYNPVDLQLLKIREMQKFYFGTKLADYLKNTGMAVWVPKSDFGDATHNGYVQLDDRVFAPEIHGAHPAGPVIPGAYFAIEPQARLFNRYMSQGIARRSPWYDMARAAGNALNSIQLAWPGFHASFVTLDTANSRFALGLQQLAHGQAAAGTKSLALGVGPGAVVKSLVEGTRLRRALLDPAAASPEYRQLADDFIMGGGRLSMDQFYQSSATGSFIHGWKDFDPRHIAHQVRQMYADAPTAWQKAVAVPIQIAFRSLDTMMHPLMGIMVPRAKIGVFSEMARTWHEANPGATPEERAAGMTTLWDNVEDRLGQMTYDNVFWHKAMKDIAFLSFRSVGWNLGTVRAGAGAVGDTAEFAADTARLRKPEFTGRMAYGIAQFTNQAIIGALITYLLTGSGPQDWLDYFFPRTGGTTPEGNPERLSIPGYVKDWIEWMIDPVGTLMNKLHPLVSLGYQIKKNRDYYGGIINPSHIDPNVNMVAAYGDFLGNSVMPFTARGYARMKAEGASEAAKAMSLFGFQPAPKSIVSPERGEVFQLKDDIKAYRRLMREPGRSHIFTPNPATQAAP